ncbi:MAG TPA: MBOAT family O-acyltransferase [Gemmataceae bacterium]|nr:MBOAT family O-acyltransferase [Gemmataceae bacterium]
MLFTTGEYVLFLTAVVTLYWLTPYHRVRVWILLVASYAFYASWNRWLALLIAGTSVADYLVARGMDATPRQRVRKALLLGSLVMNLGLLCYFKYANFFLQSLEEGLRAAGASVSFPVLSVILPVGISFYTFEAINYTVDVFRRKMPAERHLDHFLLFILFFPHLIAGPIVRASDLLPQIKKPKRWSWPRVGLGLGLLILGAFKKLAIADRMVPFVDPVFADVSKYSSAASWTAAVAFAIQVYCDFSGYSDMALGAAHLVGYKLVINFRMPFLAPNFSDFWRRWHISLSTWLRDYLFIPLGGSRHGEWKTNRNLLITMTLGGLWHGANWPMVVWGFLQGVLLVAHRLWVAFLEPFPAARAVLRSPPGTVVRVAFTFALFAITLAIFRSPTLGAGWEMLTRMFVPTNGLPTPLLMQAFWVTIVLMAVGHALGWYMTQSPFVWRRAWMEIPAPVLGVIGAAMLVTAVVLAHGATRAFIYFQF